MVKQQGIDNSKINQSELKYSCSAGEVSVNLFNDRVLFEHSDISIGANNYKIAVSHIYNSLFDEKISLKYGDGIDDYFKTGMGKGFKLNVQQYLIKDTDGSEYIYTDGVGYRHIFKELGNGSYYDTSGLGLILQIQSKEMVISDVSGNKMFFDRCFPGAGRLVRTVSCHNDKLAKIYHYNTEGQLDVIYDNRKPNTIIAFDYNQETGLLNTISCKQNSRIRLQVAYFYETQGNDDNLVQIKNTEDSSLFTYKSLGGQMEYVASLQDKSALKFEYDSYGRISGVISGAANLTSQREGDEDLLVSGNVLCGKALCGEYLHTYNIIFPDGNIKNRNYFISNDFQDLKKYVKVRNQMNKTNNEINDVNIIYYFNSKGFTTAILEAENGNLDNLKTLEKVPGKQIPLGGTITSEKINNQNVYTFQSNSALTINDSRLNDIKYYRKNKCPSYPSYYISFWLKVNGVFNNPKVRMTIESKKDLLGPKSYDSGEVFFDNTAIGVWQSVTIPVKISQQYVEEITLSFLDGSASISCSVADMRVCYTPSKKYYLRKEKDSNYGTMDDAVEIKYSVDGTSEIVKQIDSDFYMSDKDLQATYLSLFTAKNIKKSKYTLSVCDCTKKILVTQTKIRTKNKDGAYDDFPLDIETSTDDKFNERAFFYYESKSPDEKLCTIGDVYYYKSTPIPFGNSQPWVDPHHISGTPCIGQITRALKDSSKTETITYIDLNGKVLMEQDEYGVQAWYKYDDFGNVTRKIIRNKDDDIFEGERLVFNATTGETESSVTTPTKNYIKTNYHDPLGYVVSSESPYDLITTYEYDTYGNRLKSVQNNIKLENSRKEKYSKNILEYDESNRLSMVTPADSDSNFGGYGYQVKYSKFSEPEKYYLISGEDKAQQLLTEKIIDYTNRKSKTRQYRQDQQNPDELVISVDKYGRTSRMEEKSYGESDYKSTTFKRQNLNESAGAEEVTEMYDPYEDRTYSYSYDDFNNCTGYTVNSGKTSGSDFLSIQQTGENKISYNLNASKVAYTTETTYDDSKFLSPQIKKTMDLVLPSRLNDGSTEYTYDGLGRITRKLHRTIDKYADVSIVNTVTVYRPGTTLKEKITTGSSCSSKNINLYEYTYTYDYYGFIDTSHYKRTEIDSNGTSTETQDETSYTYDKAKRLKEIRDESTTGEYIYNADGSIELETEEIKRNIGTDHIITTIKKQYFYDKGRLKCIKKTDEKFQESVIEFGYDNIGNCTHYKRSGTQPANMKWERGGLLKQYVNASAFYYYNGQGNRYKKTVEGKDIIYNLDGEKLLSEKRENDKLIFAYDAEEIIGFYYVSEDTEKVMQIGMYMYVKDVQGNVIAIVKKDKEVARYKYDAWGQCRVEKNIDGMGVMNPIRWKSQYYDTESGLYFMGGRYYSPEIRRYLSAASAESMMGNAAMIYGLNPYLLTLTNPINMCYNGNTINTNIELSYDPEALSNWELFWNKYGRFVLGTVELLAGLALCLTGYGGGLGVGLIIGGGSTLISEGLTSAGMNSRGAMQVESTLTIAAGVLLCFTAMAPLGASLIGAGACGLIGGLISERVGGNYSVGWVIGNVVGGILGSYAYQGVQAIRKPYNQCGRECFIAGTLVLC